MTNSEAERYAEHERRYRAFAGKVDRREYGDIWLNQELPEFRDVNHATRLRTVRKTPDEIAVEVIEFYKTRGQRVVADIDAIAEAQGIGAALRKRGVLPVIGEMTLMSYALPKPPFVSIEKVEIEEVLSGSEKRAEWVRVQVSDEEDSRMEAMWRRVAEAEARFPLCRLFLARVGEKMVGACSLFVAERWGRIDSVITHPAYRRRGVASSLVSAVVAFSLSEGNTETYLLTEAQSAGEAVYSKLGFIEWALPLPKRHMEAI